MTTQPGTGWPFWAPSEASLVQRALDLAGVDHGVRVLDLGCGDGSVLVAAAQRGAHVRGVESDEELVVQARKNLAEAGVSGDVEAGDVFTVPLDDVDVLFTYLSPGTLQRLVPRLRRDARAGTKLVTVEYTLAGVVEAGDPDDDVHLYVLPPEDVEPSGDAAGWAAAGLL